MTLPTSSAALALEGFDLAETTPPNSLSTRLPIRKEAPDLPMVAGELERILALPPQAWQSGTDPAVRASHFTPTTLWMLGAIENSSEHPIERWLVLQSRRRWDVRLFAVDAKTGAVVAQYASGQQVLIEERGLSIPEASFTVNLSPAQRLLLVLRLQDKTFGPVVATLYDPETRERQTARMHEALVALLGFILAIVLVLLVQGDWRYMIVAIWLAGTAIYEFVYLVPLQPRLFPALTPYFVPILTVSGSLAMAAWSARSIRKRPYGNLLMALFGFYWIVVLGRIIVINGVINLDLYNDSIMLLYLFALLSFAFGIVAIESRSRRDLAADLERQLAEREAAERQRTLEQQRLENARLAAAVEEQTRALREASRRDQADSEAKSNFLSTASHELRAPLHDILGYAQLLLRQAAPQERERLSVIEKSGHQLLRLIDEILDFSRGDAKPIVLDRAPLSLAALAADLKASYQPLAARNGNRLNTSIDVGESDWVIADERRVTQILRNLLGNACKFTQNGEIELRIERLHRSARTGADRALAEPGSAAGAEDTGEGQLRLRFSVSDTGIGIPPEHQAAIFGPFKRLDRYDREPGLGLGLTISQQLANAMGGRIEVSSSQEPGSGSRFSVDLNLAQTDTQPTSSVEQQPEILGYLGPPRTLLIVDDLASSRAFLAESCEHWGFDVLQADNGAQALERLQHADPRPDAALVDQFMPQIDGWEFLRQVRESAVHRTLPVAVISAAPLKRPKGFAPEINFDDAALKPLSTTALVDILERLLGLEWEYSETASDCIDSGPWDQAQSMADLLPARSLPAHCCAEQLAELRRLLSLGALIGIRQWAQRMSQTHPDYLSLWQAIERRAASIDLDGLHALAAQLDPAAWQAAAKAASER